MIEAKLSRAKLSREVQTDTPSKKMKYSSPRLDPVGSVVALTSGPVTTKAEGTGLGFKSR